MCNVKGSSIAGGRTQEECLPSRGVLGGSEQQGSEGRVICYQMPIFLPHLKLLLGQRCLPQGAAFWTCSYTQHSKGRFDPLNQGRKPTTLQESSGREDKGCGASVRGFGQPRRGATKFMVRRLLWVAAGATG